MTFHVYLLRCAEHSYYTGRTDNLDARIAQHRRGAIPVYTVRRRPLTLLKAEAFGSRLEALQAEIQIKGRTRRKKAAWAETISTH